MIQTIDGYTAKFVTVRNASAVSEDVVTINGGAYKINLKDGVTTDGSHYVILEKKVLGSAKEGTEFKAKLKVNEISGTLLENMDTLIADVHALDGDKLSPEFKDYLGNIFKMYEGVLQEAGKDIDLNVEFFKALDESTKAFGDANPQNGKIRLMIGNTRLRTHTEILAEEMQHVLMKNAIKNNDVLAYKADQFRTAMKAELNKKYDGAGYKVFLEGIETPTQTQIDEAVGQWNYAFNNKDWPIDEFLAHATTNQALVRGLIGISTTEKLELLSPIEEKGRMWAKLWNQLVALVNKAYADIMLDGKSAHEHAVSMVHKLLEVEHRVQRLEDRSSYEKLLDTIARTDSKIAKITEEIDGEYKTYQEMIENTKRGKAKQIVAKLWNIKALAKARSFALQNNVFSSLAKNMKNPDIAKFYEMFRHSKEFVEKEVVAIRQRTAKNLDEVYGLGKVQKGAREAAKRVLIDADAQMLGDSAAIAEYLRDDAKIERELNESTAGLSPTVILDIDNTAELLVNNYSNSANVYTNAHQIAFERTANSTKETIANIDKAITLRALQKLSAEERAGALQALEQNPKGLDAAMELVREEQAMILEKAYKGNKLYVTKGAKQEYYTKDRKRYLVGEAEMKALSKAKIHNLGKDQELSEIAGQPIYVMIGDSLDTKYSEGLLKVVQLSNEGDSLKSMLMKLTEYTEEDVDVRLEMLRKRKGGAKSSLVPERSGMGEIYDYRIRVAHADKTLLMEMDNDIIATVAATVANLTHKQQAMLSNYASLAYLKRFHQMYKTDAEHKFVEIGPRSEGKFKEYWDMLPYYIKSEINKKKEPLMVTETMLTDFFGYHDASIINAPWIRDSKKRQLVAKKFEQIVMELLRNWKLQIVAFTGSTVVGNNISNMFIALQYTSFKNPLTYMNKYRQVWGMMNDYQKLRRERIDLDLKRRAGEKGLDRRIAALDASMRANPVHVIVEDGQYNVIFEDLNTSYFDKEGIIEGKINEMLKKAEDKRGRNILKSVVDVIYLRKDTAIHDSIMKATTYSDAINKMIILMDAKEQAVKLRNRGESNQVIGELLFGATEKEMEVFFKSGDIPKSWLSHMDGLHVNYGYLDNKYIKYANDMGGLVFTKYFFRILPAMARMVATKGLTVAMTETAQSLTGINVETPLDQFFDPIGTLSHKTSLWTRPENIFGTLFEGGLVRAVIE
jgi:hypothetical protein